MIITLASSKGGVGKSTITGCLAGVWAADGDSVHVDLDNNRPVSRWFGDLTGAAKYHVFARTI
jgi:cellulose biosynthesis protein BcsQ